jgi:hypothetical protein
MDKRHVIGASALALCAALGTGTGSAAPTPAPRVLTANIADYNAALVKSAGDIVTVPSGLATYTVNSGTLEVNSRFTVTLPTGFSFASQPALTNTGTSTFTLSSGGIGSQSVTFTVGTVPLEAGEKASLTTFAVQGVTALETPIPVAVALPITVQATNNSQIDNNDPKPLIAPAFASEPGASAVFVGAIQFIDLTSPVLGTEFGTNPKTDLPTAVLSAIAISPELVDAATQSHSVLQPDGSLNALSTKDTATVTISGLFNGISTGFASAASSCQTPAPGSTATVAPTALTITDVPINEEVFFCVTSGETTLLQQNPLGFNPTVAPGTSTDFLSASVDNEFPGLWTYFGGGVISVTNFLTGDDAGYASLLRVNNAGNAPADLFALVQPDTGGVALTGSLGSIGAGEGTVFSVAQVEAAVSGLNLPSSGQRATVQLIVSSGNFQSVKASSFLVNPGGVVDNVGVQKNH